MNRAASLVSGVVRLAVCVCVALLAACGSPPQQREPVAAPPSGGPTAVALHGMVLARGDWFVIYQPIAGESLRSIAAHFLGSPDRYWAIADFNGAGVAEPGQPLVVPLKSLNPIGVYADEYQTVPILAYHRFGMGGGKMVVSPSSFAAQLEWLARNDYRVIPLGQLAGYLAGRQTLPKRAVAITIDDGYESVHRYALPLLRRYGFPATLFVYTDFVGAGDALSWQQLQELAASGLIDIQAHSKTHRNLIERAPAEAEQQYRQGLEIEVRAPREILERRLPVQVRHYAFPYGDANDAVLDVLVRQHYQLAVTVNPGGNAFFAQPLMLRRTMIFGDVGLEAFKAKLQTSRPIGRPANARVVKAASAIDLDDRVPPATPLPPPASSFEQRVRDRASSQAREGRWAEEAMSWEILAALRPAAAAYRDRLEETRRAIEAAVQEPLRRAQQAHRRGELEAASIDFLAVLALQPDHEQAADALRGIERARNKAQFLGRPPRMALDRRTAPAPQAGSTRPSTPPDRNELEHATMLGSQGEYDDAIALIERRLARYGADAKACQLLADMQTQRAQKQLDRIKPPRNGTIKASSPCP